MKLRQNNWLNEWKTFSSEVSNKKSVKAAPVSTKAVKPRRRPQPLNEISQEAADKIYAWIAEHGSEISKYSFPELFGDKMRLAIPFDGKDSRNLGNIIKALWDDGWHAPGQIHGTKEELLSILDDPGGKVNVSKFPIETVKQKRRAQGGAGEEEVEEKVARLNLEKTFKKTIPKGPRAGEEILKTEKTTMSRAINKSKNISPELKKWWQNKQTFYTKNNNWQQIEKRFLHARGGKFVSEAELTVIFSRHPIDVLRMSDIGGITSCHSEGHSHFHCAVAEAKGHGPIAYTVRTEDLDRFLTHAPHGYDQDVEDTIEKLDISDFDDKEIFRDPDRSIEGLVALDRLRLRKFENHDLGDMFAVPEMRTYGNKTPGFRSFVDEWAREGQMDMFVADGDVIVPGVYDLVRHGGSYEDTKDGAILNKFFRVDRWNEYYNVEHDSQDEENELWEQYQNQVDELVIDANNRLKHTSVWGYVDGFEEPFIYGNAAYKIEFPADWFDKVGKSVIEDNNAESDIGEVLDGLYLSYEEIQIDFGNDFLQIMISFDMNDGHTPDALESFINYVESDYEDRHEMIKAKVRRMLVVNDYIEPTPFDKKAGLVSREDEPHAISEHKFWDVDYDEDEGTIEWNTKHPDEVSYASVKIWEDYVLVPSIASSTSLEEIFPDYNRLTRKSEDFFLEVMMVLRKVESEAQKYAVKQLTLPGIEPAEVDAVMGLPLISKNQNRKGDFKSIFSVKLARKSGEKPGTDAVLFRLKLTINSDVSEDEIRAVDKFIEYTDKHMDEISALIRGIYKEKYEPKVKERIMTRLKATNAIRDIRTALPQQPLSNLLELAKMANLSPYNITNFESSIKESGVNPQNESYDDVEAHVQKYAVKWRDMGEGETVYYGGRNLTREELWRELEPMRTLESRVRRIETKLSLKLGNKVSFITGFDIGDPMPDVILPVWVTNILNARGISVKTSKIQDITKTGLPEAALREAIKRAILKRLSS